jgi:Cu+-exporting ATPase
MKTIIKIEGMTCAGCAARIEHGLKQLPGVKEAEVTLGLKEAVIEYNNEQLSAQTLVERIEALGYTVPQGDSRSHEHGGHCCGWR